jgi:nicotinamide-nucleotide amidase
MGTGLNGILLGWQSECIPAHGVEHIETIHFLEYNDLTLIAALQSILDEKGEFCIAVSAEAYPLVSRILATLNGDVLIATGNTLHPASVTKVVKNSYLLRLDTAICNTLLLKNGEEIPEILLECEEKTSTWQLFGSKTELEKFKQLARDRQFHFDYCQLIEGWHEISLQTSYRLDNLLAFSDDLLLFPSDNIFDTCIEVLERKGKTITFAESCTGGLIGSSLTARSGSSAILEGSVISYANEIKHRWLNVDSDTLNHPGAVSRECVIEMAEGARRLAQSDIALATSGIAGPTGGTPLKPVGTVYIAASNNGETRTKHLLLKGDRNYIQYQAMMHTIKLMILLEKKNFEDFFRNT